MNEIVLIQKGDSLSVSPSFDFDEFKKGLEERKASASLITPTPENSALMAEQVTKNNAALKGAKALLTEAEKPILTAIKQAEKPITDFIAECEVFFKDYQTKALSAKKEAFKAKAKAKFFDPYNLPNENGELLDFEKIYDEGLYGCSEQELAQAIALRMSKASVAEEKIVASLEIHCSKAQKEQLEDWLIVNRISYFIK